MSDDKLPINSSQEPKAEKGSSTPQENSINKTISEEPSVHELEQNSNSQNGVSMTEAIFVFLESSQDRLINWRRRLRKKQKRFEKKLKGIYTDLKKPIELKTYESPITFKGRMLNVQLHFKGVGVCICNRKIHFFYDSVKHQVLPINSKDFYTKPTNKTTFQRTFPIHIFSWWSYKRQNILISTTSVYIESIVQGDIERWKTTNPNIFKNTTGVKQPIAPKVSIRKIRANFNFRCQEERLQQIYNQLRQEEL